MCPVHNIYFVIANLTPDSPLSPIRPARRLENASDNCANLRENNGGANYGDQNDRGRNRAVVNSLKSFSDAKSYIIV